MLFSTVARMVAAVTPPAPCPRFLVATWLITLFFAVATRGMPDDLLRSLRRDTIDLFYHGYDNYMAHAFPEDELKPVICKPLTRDRQNPAHIELNDVLGNYSLTLIDSLSTLAILASSPDLQHARRDPLSDFKNGVISLVELYGDGSEGPAGAGTRSKGFDLDSKVQVFETVIRGVGGLLSAHLFAVGDLPIQPSSDQLPLPVPNHHHRAAQPRTVPAEEPWPRNFEYNGQLLHLAEDLAKRLVPAFYSDTGLPYPRVNLRSGVPFYPNSPLNADAEHGICETEASGALEITETCSAGAGSLVLEFTTLSRLTGNPLYEDLAKTAFWAVWDRRSSIDLIGAGIDAESGKWVNSYTGIGAGIDSFFEYALKSHVLLSGSHQADANHSEADDYLEVWQEGHSSIKKYLYRGFPYYHPHYIQGDLNTGAPRAYWMDSLSAYYPGTLALAGELEEAIDAHMLFAALWTRYSAIPERWSSANSAIEADLKWWGGRPEFIESTWYLYQATKDPWYLFVAQMVLTDIRQRCWTECGWAGLEDVRTGELKDRMESFFLGETAKYLYLLFDPSHPLNKLDSPFVFSTEGHPLLLPKAKPVSHRPDSTTQSQPHRQSSLPSVCPVPAPPQPFTVSNVVFKPNFFHAASLARLHQVPNSKDQGFQPVESSYDQDSWQDVLGRSPTNFTFYPWTLPADYIPPHGHSSKLMSKLSFDLSFPSFPNAVPALMSLKRLHDGILINSVSGLTLELVKESTVLVDASSTEIFRVSQVAQTQLAKEDKVYMASQAVVSLNPVDPYFTRQHDSGIVDLILDSHTESTKGDFLGDQHSILPIMNAAANFSSNWTALPMVEDKQQAGLLQMVIQQITAGQNPLSAFFQNSVAQQTNGADLEKPQARSIVPAGVATGPGAAPLPHTADIPYSIKDSALPWTKIYVTDEDLCDKGLPYSVSRGYQVVVIRRGGCSFSSKLQNIPPIVESPASLQLVIVVSYPEHEENDSRKMLVRPHLDKEQLTPSGIPRIHEVAMVLVNGGEQTMTALKLARAMGLRKHYHYESQGHRIANLELV